MAKLSKSDILDKEQEAENAASMARLNDSTRCRHFTVGTNVVTSNVTSEILDIEDGSLLLRSPDGATRWVRPYAPVTR